MSSHDPADDTRAAAGDDVFESVSTAIARLESHPDTDVRAATQALLTGIDAVHRAGLTHLVQGIHGIGGDALLNRLLGDPAIRLLLMSYNLVAVDRRLQAEEALDAVRGHLHDHGVDVEIADVVGGVVYARLHIAPRESHPVAADDIRRDLESALREGLLGFQELVFRDAVSDAPPVATISVAALRQANRPVYYDAGPADLAPGTVRAAIVNEVSLLLAGVEGEIYAIGNQCGQSPLPLEFGTLEDSVLCCPWHGCRYDVRSGRRIDGVPGRQQVYPVSIEQGRIRVALGVEPVPKDR